jgi:putative salt-induced outer membrane protein
MADSAARAGTVLRRYALGGCLAAAALWGVVQADEPQPETNDPWAARAQAGYSRTGGTTDTSSANALFHVAHTLDKWKFVFATEGLYGSTRGETTAQAWNIRGQANYNFTDRLYWYAGFGYIDDKFSGFAYQAVLSTGVGYQIIKTDDTKLTAQLGVGPRRLKPQMVTLDAAGGIASVTDLPTETDAVLDGAVNLEHSFNSATKFIAGVTVHAGRDNTMTTAVAQLQVKMTEGLSLAAGYQVIHNSQPPPGVGSSSSLTTLNLVYEHKNPKLAPE